MGIGGFIAIYLPLIQNHLEAPSALSYPIIIVLIIIGGKLCFEEFLIDNSIRNKEPDLELKEGTDNIDNVNTLVFNQSEKTKRHSKPKNYESLEDWNLYPCWNEGDKGIVILNTGISSIINLAPPTLARLALVYKSPRSDGLPTDFEFESVENIEERIESLAENGDDWFIGISTINGK